MLQDGEFLTFIRKRGNYVLCTDNKHLYFGKKMKDGTLKTYGQVTNEELFFAIEFFANKNFEENDTYGFRFPSKVRDGYIEVRFTNDNDYATNRND